MSADSICNIKNLENVSFKCYNYNEKRNKGDVLMKKILYGILVVDILSLIYMFFMLISYSMIYALLAAALGGIGLVPLIALIHCLDSIDDLESEVAYLNYKLKKIEDGLGEEIKENTVPVANNSDTAIAPWKCIKCDTVNKAGTNQCANCKAPYSPFINPTDDPYAKKKVSRWVKYK